MMFKTTTHRAVSVVFGILICIPSFAQGPDQRPFVRVPYLQSLLPGQVEILWATAESAPQLDLEITAELGQRPEHTIRRRVAEGKAIYRASVRELDGDSSYSYRLRTGKTELASGSFRTPPSSGGSVRLAVFGDSGVARDAQYRVGALVKSWKPQGILHTGDMDYVGNFDRSVLEPYADLLHSTCLFPARGNHDLHLSFADHFVAPGTEFEETHYYSFDWGPAHIVVLDTTLSVGSSEFDEQLTFLDSDLSAARQGASPWVIVVMHTPIFTVGPHAIDAELIGVRNTLTPFLDHHKVDLVLSGDDHMYQRSYPLRVFDEDCPGLDPRRCEEGPLPKCYETDKRSETDFASPNGTTYIVTGGGGQFLYFRLNPTDECLFVDGEFTAVDEAEWHAVRLDIEETRIVGVAAKPDGTVLDRFTISNLEAIRGDANADNDVNLADAITILGDLFLGTPAACPSASDVNADSRTEITDAVLLLRHAFLGGTPPAPPYPGCGPLDQPGAFSCPPAACRSAR